MIKNFYKREDIQKQVRDLCAKFWTDNSHLLATDKNENVITDRGFIKNMFSFVYESYTGKLIVQDYIGIDLWNICCVGETMLEMCSKYNAIPNRLLLSIITGVPSYVLGRIENNQDYETIQRLDNEYGQDYKTYFKKTFNEEHKSINDKINLTNNIEHAYPVYCLVKQIKEWEKDSRVERSKLGDITLLNAPEEKGGFGFAHPSIQVDNRQLIIGDERKLLETYAFAKKHINKVDVEKQDLKEEALDLFEGIDEK